MPYLVDGHNLIPHIPGLTLEDLDDENSLIEILGEYASQQRTQIEIYFDRAAPSQSGSRSFGRVKAHFVPREKTADQAIISRLQRLGGSAKNWTVVSSDRVIQAEVRSCHSIVMPSQEFAALLRKRSIGNGENLKGEDPQIDEDEINFWLDQFKQK
ncbi:MAG: NYN domain-containing protein [Anaerolineales bacterium]